MIVTVLKSGGEYTPEHVERLRDQVHETTDDDFYCLTDMEVDCPSIPLVHGWPGWWSKIELFAGHIRDCVYLDLDSDVIGDLSVLKRDRFTMITDFYLPEYPQSGVMAWGEPPTEVYESFDPQKHMAEYKSHRKWGDGGFIRDHSDPERFEDGLIASYKMHVRPNKIPENAVAIAYHGKPKPWQI